MSNYYTALMALCWMALGVLSVLVRENSWIPREDKRHFYLTYGIIALSALAEWVGLCLSGRESVPGWVLSAVKCFDYTLSPMAGGAIVAQMKLRDRWSRALMGVLAVNTVFQILALFNGWMVVLDAGNHYAHGPLYFVYMIVYMLVIALTGAAFMAYGRSYRRQNRTSLYSVLLLVLAGIFIQEALGGAYRTAYIAMTMGAALMFIHYAEFYQMSKDDYIRQQRNQLMKDALTGVFSRHAYMKALEKYRAAERLPDDLAAFTIDINGLKSVNDSIGHEAGDELIVGAARCIEKVFGMKSACFRTGGDEFVVLTRMERAQAEDALRRLEQVTGAWTGEMVKALSLSAGWALAGEHPGMPVEKLLQEADRAMYAAKDAYYQNKGIDRRRRAANA